MLKTLDRYQKCSYGAVEVNKPAKELETQFMLDQLSDLQNKEQLLLEANRALTIKLDEISARNSLRSSWEGGEQSMSYGQQHPQSQELFQRLVCNPTLQIGYNPVGTDQMNATTHAQQVNGFIPGWMMDALSFVHALLLPCCSEDLDDMLLLSGCFGKYM